MSSDSTTWGVQPNGFVCPTQQDLLDNLVANLHQYVDSDLDTSPDSPEGQKLGVYTRQLALAWEALRAQHAAKSRDGAEGDALDEQGKMTGTSRDAASPTRVMATVWLDAGTTLVAGENLASITDHPDRQFTPIADYTAATSGLHNVLFQCTKTGILAVSVNTLRVIATPITGWLSVDNAAVGIPGDNGDDDAQFRARQERDLTRAGSCTAAALQTDIPYVAATGTGVPGILSCSVLENTTDWIDSNGLPPHSIEVVVLGDGTEILENLAAAIYTSKAATAQTYGALSASFVDATGVTRTVRYSVFTVVPIWISYDLSVVSDYVGDAAVKDAVVLALTERSIKDTTVPFFFVAGLPYAQVGVRAVVSCHIGLASTPTGTSDLVMSSPRHLPTFSVDRITIA